MSIPRYLVGNTRLAKWVSSGQSPTSIWVEFENGSGTSVNSISMTDSGNGHYWQAVTVPSTPGYYVMQTTAVIGGDPYKKRLRFRAVTQETD